MSDCICPRKKFCYKCGEPLELHHESCLLDSYDVLTGERNTNDSDWLECSNTRCPRFKQKDYVTTVQDFSCLHFRHL